MITETHNGLRPGGAYAPEGSQNPVALAQELYEGRGLDENKFAADIWEHLLKGFLVSTPRLFAMARAVMLDDGRHAWLFDMLIGPLEEALHHIPFPLECIAFYRRDGKKLKIYEFGRFVHLAKGKLP